MKGILTSVFCCCLGLLNAQIPQIFPAIPAAEDIQLIYPSYPIDVQAAAKLEYNKITQWYETYQKGETDESGLVWSVPLQAYQACVIQLNPLGVENATFYDPENNRLRRLDYYYINGLVSAIDEFKFDQEQKELLQFTDAYFYEANGRPIQRMRQFAKDKGLRELLAFRFDPENRPSKFKTTFSGQATKPQTMALIETGQQLLSWEYGSTSRRSTFQNGNELVEMYEYELSENLPKTVKHYGRNYQLISQHECQHENGKLYRISTQYSSSVMLSDNPIPRSETYFFYNDEGLLERIMVERGDVQEVYNYSYSKS